MMKAAHTQPMYSLRNHDEHYYTTLEMMICTHEADGDDYVQGLLNLNEGTPGKLLYSYGYATLL